MVMLILVFTCIQPIAKIEKKIFEIFYSHFVTAVAKIFKEHKKYPRKIFLNPECVLPCSLNFQGKNTMNNAYLFRHYVTNPILVNHVIVEVQAGKTNSGFPKTF